MKITTNVFLEGIQTDLHPLSTSQKVLTDALNATMLTYNGNEMMLLNDMGNTLIQDSATGNIMGLNPGFIPTGIKEHGGIMYITSVGKDDNGNPIGEIGTIPSPIIRDIYKDKITYTVNNFIPIGIGDPLTITHKLYPADKFIVNLNMLVDESSLIGTKHYKASALSDDEGKPDWDPSDIVLSRKVIGFAGRTYSLYTPLISYADPEDKKVQLLQQTKSTNEVDLFSTKGIYSLDMYSTNVNGSKKVSGPLTYPLQYTGGISKYWYLHNDGYESVFPKDLFEATLNKSLKQFPSSNKPGQLAVKLTPEKIGEFGMLPRKNDPKNTPITVKWTSPSTRYRSFFPGFYYSTDSGIYIDKLKNIRVVDENSGKDVSLSIYNGSIDRKSTISFLNITLNPYPSTVSKAGFFTTKLWENNGLYPQTVSQASYELTNNLYPKWEGNSVFFILSSICDIKDHTKTELVSSTEGQDTHPHGGLFLADLGAKYNNWYRLELDYYDQYDNLQGSFSTRFNPYINDTFGTNLDITGVEMVDGIVMGLKYNKTGSIDIPLSADKVLKTLHYYPSYSNNTWNYDIDNYKIPGGFSSLAGIPDGTASPIRIKKDEHTLLDSWGEYSTKFEIVNSHSSLLYNYKFPKNIIQRDLKYLYKNNEKVISVNLLIDTSNYSSQIGCDTASQGGQLKSPKIVFCGKKYVRKSNELPSFAYWEKNNNDHYFISSVYSNKANTLEEHSIQDGTTYFGYPLINSSSEPEYYPPTDLGKFHNSLSVQPESSEIYSIDQLLKIEDSAEPTIASFSVLKNLNLYLDIKNGDNETPSFSDLESPGTGNIFDDLNRDVQENLGFLVYQQGGAHFAITNIFEKDIEAVCEYNINLTPAYKITPYFLLTGTADTTTSVYPRRFVSYKKENGQFKYIDNMSYEYNLEKVSVALGITSSKITIPNSSYLKELEGYAADIAGVKLTLDAGIYTLNITGVPNKLNQPATITVKDKELAVHTTGALHTDEGTISNEFYFYQPVVFILEQREDVTISTEGINAFQEIGLYKVNTVNESSLSAFIDMYKNAGGQTECTYQEYMNSLIDTVLTQDLNAPNEELLPSERYALIQKYGIFFKEAYVFTEGLCNDTNTTINQVKIDDSLTYTAVPYIPADPSILPITLQPDSKGELIYTWNIYVMPDSILETNYEGKDADIPDFVFTNGVPTAVPTTTKPGSYNLRKSYDGFDLPIRDILNDPTNMIPQGPVILGPLSPK